MEMINMDAILLAFVSKNVITTGLVFGVLKIFAREAHWATGNKILELLTGTLLTGKK